MLKKLSLILLSTVSLSSVVYAYPSADQVNKAQIHNYNRCIQQCNTKPGHKISQCQQNCDRKFPGVAHG